MSAIYNPLIGGKVLKVEDDYSVQPAMFVLGKDKNTYMITISNSQRFVFVRVDQNMKVQNND
ncbi:MAG: hypothetical protein IKJ74_01120 [Clostridia bacterium]|nr:hypothetical protein [Clostridia bacterium]